MLPENKKEDTNKLTKLVFKMISILHNTLLATHKLKYYSGAFANFWGPPNQQLQFYGTKLKFYSGEICRFGESPKLKFYPGVFCPFWGPTGAFWGSEAQNQILILGHLSFWGGSQT
jgi:hypothetical protein